MKVSEALEKLTDALRLRHFSLATEKSYRLWLRSCMAVLGGCKRRLKSAAGSRM